MAMRSFTAEEIAGITGGEVLRPTARPLAGLALDSRTVRKGMLFAALRGEIARALEPLYGAPVGVTQQSEPGELFGVRVRASSEPGVEELLARLARSAG